MLALVEFYQQGEKDMALFGVTVETISSIMQIEGAKTVELVSLEGLSFSAVVPKGVFTVGERCLYFPLDSVLPEELATQMGIKSKLGRKGRVKTVRVLGHLSQGIVEKTSLIPGDYLDSSPELIAYFLGVTKYEPDVENADGASRLPYELSKYDIEGADRNKELVTYLLDKDVMITEKLEGSNVSVAIGLDGNVHVNTRRRSVLEDSSDGKMYWEGAKSSGMFAFAECLFSRLLGRQLIVVYGELLGPKVQGNIYGMGSFTAKIFDVLVGDKWLSPRSLLEEIDDYTVLPISSVPVLFIGKFSDWLEGRTVKDASNGWSVLNEGRRREGIVIRPLVEEEIPRFGRLILKQRSPEYLLHSKV